MRLKYQLFLILLLSSVLLIALLAAINSWTIDRGFSRYFVDSERQRLSGVMVRLIQAHEDNAGWEWIENDPSALQSLLGRSGTNRLSAKGKNKQDRAEASGERERRAPPPSRARDNGPGRLLLLDQNRELLVGEQIPLRHVVWEKLESNDETIGFVGIRKPRGLPGNVEEVFIAQQLRSNMYAAILMVFISALLAILCASKIVKPILNVNKAVGLISGGDYDHQIEKISKDEIGDLSKKINQLARTLKNNQLARRQWMAEISHELRTPVAVLQGELESMQDGVSDINRESIDSLHSESTRLGALIDDLHQLALSDIGALEYKMSPVDICGLIQQRLQVAEIPIAQAGLSVSLHTDENLLKLYCDSQRLEQLVDNLLQNSLRYTDTQGEISITVKSDSETMVIDWKDSSPGVSDDQLVQLFNPLYRTDESRNRNTGGSGLGLTVVQKIVESHNGTIEAYHSALGGLGLTIRFPHEPLKPS